MTTYVWIQPNQKNTKKIVTQPNPWMDPIHRSCQTQLKTLTIYTVQEAQLMLTNPFRGQSRSPNSTIRYVRYGFLL